LKNSNWNQKGAKPCADIIAEFKKKVKSGKMQKRRLERVKKI
jgi:hypothetical protein